MRAAFAMVLVLLLGVLVHPVAAARQPAQDHAGAGADPTGVDVDTPRRPTLSRSSSAVHDRLDLSDDDTPALMSSSRGVHRSRRAAAPDPSGYTTARTMWRAPAARSRGPPQ
jgi:hypothetical protein